MGGKLLLILFIIVRCLMVNLVKVGNLVIIFLGNEINSNYCQHRQTTNHTNILSAYITYFAYYIINLIWHLKNMKEWHSLSAWIAFWIKVWKGLMSLWWAAYMTGISSNSSWIMVPKDILQSHPLRTPYWKRLLVFRFESNAVFFEFSIQSVSTNT